MVGAAKGESWACRIAMLCDESTNDRRIFAAIYNTDIPPPDAASFLPPSYLPRVDISLNLSVALLGFAKVVRSAMERSRH